MIDFESGKTIRDFSNDNPESNLGSDCSSVLGIAFSPDGKRMASGGFDNDKGNYFARLWDVETGKELRRFMHGKQQLRHSESGVFSRRENAGHPCARRLVSGSLTWTPAKNGKRSRRMAAAGELGTVAFAPDGKTVAAAGDSIRLYDATTGEERLRIDRKQASGLHFTDGGKTLTAAVMGAIYRWDTATGKSLTPEAGDSVVEQILVTRRRQSGRHARPRWRRPHLGWRERQASPRDSRPAWQRGMAISPDGRFLAWPVDDERQVHRSPGLPIRSITARASACTTSPPTNLWTAFPLSKGMPTT